MLPLVAGPPPEFRAGRSVAVNLCVLAWQWCWPISFSWKPPPWKFPRSPECDTADRPRYRPSGFFFLFFFLFFPRAFQHVRVVLAIVHQSLVATIAKARRRPAVASALATPFAALILSKLRGRRFRLYPNVRPGWSPASDALALRGSHYATGRALEAIRPLALAAGPGISSLSSTKSRRGIYRIRLKDIDGNIFVTSLAAEKLAEHGRTQYIGRGRRTSLQMGGHTSHELGAETVGWRFAGPGHE